MHEQKKYTIKLNAGTGRSTLTINHFTTNDEGEYSCVIENSRKSFPSKSARIELGRYHCQNIKFMMS